MLCVTTIFIRCRDKKKRHHTENKTGSLRLIIVPFACTSVWAENPFCQVSCFLNISQTHAQTNCEV